MRTLLQDWQYVRPFDSNSGEVKRFKDRLRLTVGRDYPWLCGELFRIEGELGWGPGFREDEESVFPEPMEEAPARMTTFLNTLEHVEKDNRLIRLLTASKGDMPGDKACQYLQRCRQGFQEAKMGHLIMHFYNRLARGNWQWTYSLAAARIYLSLWGHQHKFWLALAGLINLVCNPLSERTVNAETVHRKCRFAKKHSLSLAQTANLVELRAC